MPATRHGDAKGVHAAVAPMGRSYNGAMTDSDSTSLDSFVGKWRSRWPEWHIASVFVPASQRALAAAWFALLQELTDAAWTGSDAAPGLAKLAWWQEELRGWSRGARRHPLGEALQKRDAPWGALAAALSALPVTRAPASDEDDATGLRAFASAVLSVETALFGGNPVQEASIDVLAAALRVERALSRGDGEAARRLAGTWRADGSASLPRRLHGVVLRERLRTTAGDATRTRIPALRLLFAGWRAARN